MQPANSPPAGGTQITRDTLPFGFRQPTLQQGKIGIVTCGSWFLVALPVAPAIVRLKPR